MASVRKRKSDKARGPSGNYTMFWLDEHGKKRSRVGTPNRAESLARAHELEQQALAIQEGREDPAERAFREAAKKSPAAHLADFRADLEARKNTRLYVLNTVSSIERIFGSAKIESIADLAPDRVREAVSARKDARSSRTANADLKAVKAFARWLHDLGRIKEVPRGFARIHTYPVGSDRRRVRRSLTRAEFAKLIAAVLDAPPYGLRWDGRRKGRPPIAVISGLDRAMAYRLAVETGFRANEIRSLTPESFDLDPADPAVTVLAAFSKRGKKSGRADRQPIRREFAAELKPWLAGREPGRGVLSLPGECGRMLTADLKRAGIERQTKEGIVDFHSLRHTYVTWLVEDGRNIKIVQTLARHSDVRLTIDTYTHTSESNLRDAVERTAGNGVADLDALRAEIERLRKDGEK